MDFLETKEYCLIIHNGKNYHFPFEISVKNVLRRKSHAGLKKMIDESTKLVISENSAHNIGQNIQNMNVIPSIDAKEYFHHEGGNIALQLLGYTVEEINKAAAGLRVKFFVPEIWAPEITRKAGVFVGGDTTALTMLRMKLGS